MQLILNWLYMFLDYVLGFLHFALPPNMYNTVVSIAKFGVLANQYVDIPSFLSIAAYCVTIHLLLMVVSAVLQLL